VRVLATHSIREFSLHFPTRVPPGFKHTLTLDTPCSEVVWRVLATQSICQFPLHFPSRASPCAITFQLESTSINASKRMCGALFLHFHTSPRRCAWARGLVPVPMKRISPLFTWGTDDSCYIFPFPRAWYLPHPIVQAVRQVTFVALTLYAAQHHGRRVATEEICLYGVIGIAQSQLVADHHSFEYTPAVSAHQTPSCNSSNRYYSV